MLNFLAVFCLAAQEEGAVLFQEEENLTFFWWGHVCWSPLLSYACEQAMMLLLWCRSPYKRHACGLFEKVPARLSCLMVQPG